MATYYVNDHLQTPGGSRVVIGGRRYRRFTTGPGGGSDTNACQYNYTIDIPEASIIRQQQLGICRLGGRSYVIGTLAGSAAEDGVLRFANPEVQHAATAPSLPDNVKTLDLGNGLLVWTEDSSGNATSVTFVPSAPTVDADD